MYKQLVEMNGTAIKNNKILMNKIVTSNKTIYKLYKQLATQSTTIIIMSETMGNIEARMNVLKETVTPDYYSAASKSAQENVKTIGQDYCTQDDTKLLIQDKSIALFPIWRLQYNPKPTLYPHLYRNTFTRWKRIRNTMSLIRKK